MIIDKTLVRLLGCPVRLVSDPREYIVDYVDELTRELLVHPTDRPNEKYWISAHSLVKNANGNQGGKGGDVPPTSTP